MKTFGRSLAVGAAVVLLATAAIPGFAQGSHGGGGGGGGGHGFSGGGHSGGGGGGHVASAPHFAARAPAYHSGFAGFSAHSAYASHPSVSYASGARYSPGLGGGVAHSGNWSAHGAVSRPGNWGHYGPGAPGWRYGRWGGGYWRGGYWPPVFWGAGFAWFLPVLPAFCATYWWNSVPYYYYNDVYYAWDPAADGYVVTNPPPAAADAPAEAQAAPTADDGDGAIPPGAGYSQPPPNYSQPPPNASAPPPSSDHIYAYPKNGQTADQQALDRRECEQWASSEVSSGSSNASPAGIDYRRAMSACLQGRGYSVD